LGKDVLEDKVFMYNVKVNLKELSWDYLRSIHLNQSRETWQALVNIVMKYHRLLNAGH